VSRFIGAAFLSAQGPRTYKTGPRSPPSPFAVILSEAKDLAPGLCVKRPNQGKILRLAQIDSAYGLLRNL